jgi:hypothetical protein
MVRLILAALLAAAALSACGSVDGGPTGVYGGVDAGGEIRR